MYHICSCVIATETELGGVKIAFKRAKIFRQNLCAVEGSHCSAYQRHHHWNNIAVLRYNVILEKKRKKNSNALLFQLLWYRLVLKLWISACRIQGIIKQSCTKQARTVPSPFLHWQQCNKSNYILKFIKCDILVAFCRLDWFSDAVYFIAYISRLQLFTRMWRNGNFQ